MKPTLIKFSADVSWFCHPWLGHVRAMCKRMLVGAEAFPLAAEMMGDLKQRKTDPVPSSLCKHLCVDFLLIIPVTQCSRRLLTSR